MSVRRSVRARSFGPNLRSVGRVENIQDRVDDSSARRRQRRSPPPSIRLSTPPIIRPAHERISALCAARPAGTGHIGVAAVFGVRYPSRSLGDCFRRQERVGQERRHLDWLDYWAAGAPISPDGERARCQMDRAMEGQNEAKCRRQPVPIREQRVHADCIGIVHGGTLSRRRAKLPEDTASLNAGCLRRPAASAAAGPSPDVPAAHSLRLRTLENPRLDTAGQVSGAHK